MAIDVINIEKSGNDIIYFGTIKEEDTFKVVDIFESENLRCLGFIDFASNTIFNSLQAQEIIKEIEMLNQKKIIPKYVFNMIKKSAEAMKKNKGKYYLLFEGE